MTPLKNRIFPSKYGGIACTDVKVIYSKSWSKSSSPLGHTLLCKTLNSWTIWVAWGSKGGKGVAFPPMLQRFREKEVLQDWEVYDLLKCVTHPGYLRRFCSRAKIGRNSERLHKNIDIHFLQPEGWNATRVRPGTSRQIMSKEKCANFTYQQKLKVVKKYISHLRRTLRWTFYYFFFSFSSGSVCTPHGSRVLWLEKDTSVCTPMLILAFWKWL